MKSQHPQPNMNVRLPLAMRSKLQTQADKHDWSLNHLVRRALEEWLEYHSPGAKPRPSTTIVRGL
jgi:predicted HicB family RNase H-like nuclease